MPYNTCMPSSVSRMLMTMMMTMMMMMMISMIVSNCSCTFYHVCITSTYRTVYCIAMYRTVGHAHSNRNSAMDDEFDF